MMKSIRSNALQRAVRVIREPRRVVDHIAWWADRYHNYTAMRQALATLWLRYSSCESLAERVDLVLSDPIFGAMQRSHEITELLAMLQRNPPQYICEIGTASGGTLFLLARVSRPGALLLSVDKGLSLERSLVHAHFAAEAQRVISMRGDSCSPEIIERVRSALGGRLLDLLFIDGDHTYDGVEADFTNYVPFVAKGGLIVIHDIVTDFRTRYGVHTTGSPYTGEVPVFWQEVKAAHKTSEIIEGPEQDGFGIGIVHN